MDKIIIGTHDSMTFLKPRTALMRMVQKYGKCQTKNIEQQLDVAQCMDLRVFWHGNKWCFAHGMLEYTSKEINGVMKEIYEYNKEKHNGRDLYIRLILEKTDDMSDAFARLCKSLELRYPDVIFLGGNRKSDWKKLYEFKSGITDIDMHQFVSSMQGAKWYKTPKDYAKKHNAENLLKVENGINLFDFL